MSQISDITRTLKQLLKQHQLTYKDVALHLQLSEANVKRVFASEQFSLQRLEQICELMQLQLSDLFLLTEQQSPGVQQLTEQQEQELVNDVKLFLVAVCVRDGWSFAEILEQYQVDEYELIRLFARLDRLRMIDLLPNNQYKLLIAQDFRWLAGGPLQRYIEGQVLQEFLQGDFSQPDSFRFYIRGSFSDNSVALLQRRLEQLTKEAGQLNLQDHALPLAKRRHVGLLMALRPWQLPSFSQLLRPGVSGPTQRKSQP